LHAGSRGFKSHPVHHQVYAKPAEFLYFLGLGIKIYMYP
jgi:hypothetical protein